MLVLCLSLREVSGVWVGVEPLSGTCDVEVGNAPDCLVTRGASSYVEEGGCPFKVGVGSALGFEVGG